MMNSYVRVSAASVRTKIGDFSHNRHCIIGAITEAVEQQESDIILLPELVITGYGMLDFFSSPDFNSCVVESLKCVVDIVKELGDKIDRDFMVALGLPVMVQGGQLFNGVALISSKDGLAGISCKKNLAIDGIHYESRWFRAWPKGVATYDDTYGCMVGDLIVSLAGVRIGFEICEDSWVADRPARDLYDRRVDIILNPSASHFAAGKYEIREQFVKEGARAFGAAYVYSNLTGCEEGQAIYDAGCMIADQTGVIARGERFSFKDYSLTSSIIDVTANRVIRNASSQAIPPHNDENCIALDFTFSRSKKVMSYDSLQAQWENDIYNSDLEVLYAGCLGTFDWQCVKGLHGSVVSLSGGADSALVVGFEYLSHVTAFHELGLQQYKSRLLESGQGGREVKETIKSLAYSEEFDAWLSKKLIPLLLTTVYQATDNSSEATAGAAQAIADNVGSTHHYWSIQREVESFKSKLPSLDVDSLVDDKPIQNIQARLRMPGAWLLANVEKKALLCTSNLTEAWVGYVSLDGDSAGIRAPISGIFKTRVLRLNRLIASGFKLNNGKVICLPAFDDVNNLKPSAELRKEEQTDEDDLMPFPLLEAIISANVKEHRMPAGILEKLVITKQFESYSVKNLAENIKKAFILFSVSQVKRHKSAAGFQMEIESVDPKTYSRAPLMNHWLSHQLEKLNEMAIRLDNNN